MEHLPSGAWSAARQLFGCLQSKVESAVDRDNTRSWIALSRSRDNHTVVRPRLDANAVTMFVAVIDEGSFQKPMDYWIGAMTFTPDGKYLITGSRDQTIKMFEMPEALEHRTLKGHGGWIRSLVVTGDGKVLISSGDDNTIRFWDLKTGRCFRTLKGHQGAVRGVALSSDGLRLASASWDRTVKLWEGGAEPAE